MPTKFYRSLSHGAASRGVAVRVVQVTDLTVDTDTPDGVSITCWAGDGGELFRVDLPCANPLLLLRELAHSLEEHVDELAARLDDIQADPDRDPVARRAARRMLGL